MYSFGMLLWSTITRERVRVPNGPSNNISTIFQPPIPTYVVSPVAELIRSCWSEVPLDRPDITKGECAAFLLSVR